MQLMKPCEDLCVSIFPWNSPNLISLKTTAFIMYSPRAILSFHRPIRLIPVPCVNEVSSFIESRWEVILKSEGQADSRYHIFSYAENSCDFVLKSSKLEFFSSKPISELYLPHSRINPPLNLRKILDIILEFYDTKRRHNLQLNLVVNLKRLTEVWKKSILMGLDEPSALPSILV